MDFGPNSPPSRLTQSLAPTTLNSLYSTTIEPPLPKNKCPHIALAKNRAPAAWFWILAPTQPPLAQCPITPPDHLKPSVRLPNMILSTRKRTPPHCIGQNGALAARFRNLAVTRPLPLVHCLIPPHHHLKPGEPYPNQVSCT